ncbi:vWA domain-containing protein [Cryptosporangium minutisporangium]|uniref:vWA domain-containing protein n=1 Tax=Cryptosporangium minutisporangium TaxID=113569 RepID=UPI0035F0BA2A
MPDRDPRGDHRTSGDHRPGQVRTSGDHRPGQVPAAGGTRVVPGGLAVEPAALADRFVEALRRGGVPAGTDRAARFAAALRLVPPSSRDRLYWTARTTLVSDATQVAAFDAVFAGVFGDDAPPVDLADSRGDPNAPPLPDTTPETRPAPPDNRPAEPAPSGASAGSSSAGNEPGEPRAVPALASATERLQHTAFAELTADEVDAVRQLVRRLVLATPLRRTRRSRASTKNGERIDVRRTVRAARKTGGDPVALVHRRRRRRPRPLVLLCDVSGSMEPYTRVFLALLHGCVFGGRRVAGARAEAFVFATRLTRLTRSLAARDPDLALRRAAEAAPDWAGGTRLAEALRRFLDDHGRRGLARGAVVVVLSDGWAQDEPADVAAQMARLRRVAHRIVWVNPRKAAAGYAPKVGGMAAALPYCDAFVSGHSLAALNEVAAAVAACGPRSPSRPGPNLQKGYR